VSSATADGAGTGEFSLGMVLGAAAETGEALKGAELMGESKCGQVLGGRLILCLSATKKRRLSTSFDGLATAPLFQASLTLQPKSAVILGSAQFQASFLS
jgi:hypothetical protein